MQTLTIASGGWGGTWNRENVILFATLGNPITRIAAAGGDPVPLSGLALRGSDFLPSFLPDGRRFLYYVRGNPESRGVYVGDLDGRLTPRRLFDSDTAGVYAPSGHVLFALQGTLFAHAFDPVQLALTGKPFPITEHVASESWGLNISVSRTGSIAYRGSSRIPERQLVWFSRSGQEGAHLGDPSRTLSEPSLSPDSKRVAITEASVPAPTSGYSTRLAA